MTGSHIRSIAVAGGGLAGWMAAATLGRLLKADFCKTVVVERPAATEIGTVEAVTPAFQRFNNLLGIAEADFVARTDATFKLGTDYQGWARHPFFHAFGPFGGTIAGVDFHHQWLRLRRLGDETPIEAYSMAAQAARRNRFTRPVEHPQSVLSMFSHGYHFDAARYTAMLRNYAMRRGVESVDAAVAGARLRGEDGFVRSLVLDDGREIEADFFIDCTGGSIHGSALGTGFDDWSRWFPSDRVAAVTLSDHAAPRPYTIAHAGPAGWQWIRPLRGRVERAFVYSGRQTSDEQAVEQLSGGAAASQVRLARLRPGRWQRILHRNCLALPGGALDPVEDTAVHVIQTGILKLFGAFPDRGFDPSDADEYNRLAAMELERARDFLILHYHLARDRNGAFWARPEGEVPDALRHKIDLFRASARINMLDNEHFGEQSWLSLYLGHGVIPDRHDPLADVVDIETVKRHLARMRQLIAEAADAMPTQAHYLAQLRATGMEPAA